MSGSFDLSLLRDGLNFPEFRRYFGAMYRTLIDNVGKPKIRIVIQDDDPDDIASAIVSSNSNSLVNVDAVNFMIYKQLELIKATLPSSWESFTAEIGKEGDIITPLSLLNVYTDGDSKPKANLPLKTYRCTARQAMYYIFAPISLDVDYAAQKKARAAKMVAAIPGGEKLSSVSHENIAQLYSSLRNNITYNRMAFALDMFMERFPNHSEYNMRVGTECLRFKNSAGSLLISHFATLMDEPDRNQLLQWIWHESALNNAKKLLDPGNAPDDAYSYAPYMWSIDASFKSNCGIKYNLDLQVFVHTVGAIAGDKRSKDAKFLNDCCTSPMYSAFIVGAIVSLHRQHATVQVSENSQDMNIVKKAGVCPTSMDPQAWNKYLKGTSGLSKVYLRYGARLALRLTNLRPKTIGAKCVEYAKSVVDA